MKPLETAFAYYRQSRILVHVSNQLHPHKRFAKLLSPLSYLVLEGFKMRRTPLGVEFSDSKGSILLNADYSKTFLREFEEWGRSYSADVKGKTVLDIGAGCGETAFFYFRNGAKRVIAVEANPACWPYLEANRKRNAWDMDIIQGRFALFQLGLRHDFVKMDVEGAEEMLLDGSIRTLGPCRIEVHPNIIGKETALQVVEKFGLSKKNTAFVYGRDD